MKKIKIIISYGCSSLFSVISFAQSGRYDFTPEINDEEFYLSGSGNGIYLFGLIYLLLIIFGGKGLRYVLLTIALGLFGFIAYAYALHVIGVASQVFMFGDSPKNRDVSGFGLFTFVIGYFSPIFVYSQRKLDGSSNKSNSLILGTIFTIVFILFICSYFYLPSKIKLFGA
jgi:hypothetical protein